MVVVDEAHKMSASYYGNDLKRTKRYISTSPQRLGISSS